MKSLFSLLAFAFVICLASGCGNGDGDMTTPDRCDGVLFQEDVNPKLTAWQDAASAWSANPTPANCEEYKSTGDAWLVAVRQYDDCAVLWNTWREAVDEARADLAAVECN
ncbi:MAG: hypothetical protein AAFZ52_16580 [Bacteroidota bacterium]